MRDTKVDLWEVRMHLKRICSEAVELESALMRLYDAMNDSGDHREQDDDFQTLLTKAEDIVHYALNV